MSLSFSLSPSSPPSFPLSHSLSLCVILRLSIVSSQSRIPQLKYDGGWSWIIQEHCILSRPQRRGETVEHAPCSVDHPHVSGRHHIAYASCRFCRSYIYSSMNIQQVLEFSTNRPTLKTNSKYSMLPENTHTHNENAVLYTCEKVWVIESNNELPPVMKTKHIERK